MEVQNRCQQRLEENVTSEPPSMRKLKNQGLEGIEKASKIYIKATSQAYSQNVQKIDPKVSQNGHRSDPRGPQDEVKI